MLWMHQGKSIATEVAPTTEVAPAVQLGFDPSQDTTVSRADLLAAEQAPLDGQCHIP